MGNSTRKTGGRTKRDSVSALVPVYNEEKTVAIVLKKLASLEYITEIVVVNDASSDDSAREIQSVKSKKIKFFSLEKNSGKTAAINLAIKKSTSRILVIQDADLEYDPLELEEVLDPIWNGQADVVYGSRFLVRKAARVLYFGHYLANISLTFLSNVLTNINMTDIETCYKAFKAPIFKDYELTSKGFGMEVEITAMISKMNLRIYEVPISYYGRTYEEGKKIGIKDGILALYYIFYYNLIHSLKPSIRKHIQKISAES